MKCFTTVGTKRLDALSLLKKIKKIYLWPRASWIFTLKVQYKFLCIITVELGNKNTVSRSLKLRQSKKSLMTNFVTKSLVYRVPTYTLSLV